MRGRRESGGHSGRPARSRPRVARRLGSLVLVVASTVFLPSCLRLIGGVGTSPDGEPPDATEGDADAESSGGDADETADADLDGVDGDDAPCGPQCAGRACGPDGCGGTCPPGCDVGEACGTDGQCHPLAPEGFVYVAGGTFTMGTPLSESGRDPGETEHQVTLTHDFAIAALEISQGEFQLLMGYQPAFDDGCGADCPVESVSWHEAAAYCNALSDSEGLEQCYQCSGTGLLTCDLSATLRSPYDCDGYRLVTEAEWELAARAGTSTATYNGDLDVAETACTSSRVLDPIAWWCWNGLRAIHLRGTRTPNDWGLHDMLGNVSEWCHDVFADYPGVDLTDPFGPASGTHRVSRGGNYDDFARSLRSGFRLDLVPTSQSRRQGFRVAITMP